MKLLVYYPGISDKEVEGDNYNSLKTVLKTKYGADEVVIFNWEKWRDRQPLYRFLTMTLKLLQLASKLPLFIFEPLLDKLADIPSVRKYVKKEIPDYDIEIVKQYLNGFNDPHVDLVFVGHSLGTIPALHLAQHFSPSSTVHLYAPPIGYKGFHSLYKPLLKRQLGETLIFLGMDDPITWLISPKDREKTHPRIKVELVDSGHDFYELLYRQKMIKSNIGLGNLFDKIEKS
jgi:hypothetical protein